MSSFTDGSSAPQVSEPRGKGRPGGEREAQPRSADDRGHWLAGRLAVVTGASRGIGAATADALAAVGARVVLAARDAAALAGVARRIRDARGAALPVPTDVTSAARAD